MVGLCGLFYGLIRGCFMTGFWTILWPNWGLFWDPFVAILWLVCGLFHGLIGDCFVPCFMAILWLV